MRPILTSILILAFAVSYGQSFSYPQIISRAENSKAFVPAGWIILDSALGDLNKDGLDDAVLIIQHRDSIAWTNDQGDSVITQPRILVILFKKDGQYELAIQSNSFILDHDNPSMEDPYTQMRINRNILDLSFHQFYNMGSWYVTNVSYKFRYQDGNFVLIGADWDSFHRASHDYESRSYNFLTGKSVITKGNEEKGARKNTVKPTRISPLKTIETLGRPFSWEIEKDFFL